MFLNKHVVGEFDNLEVITVEVTVQQHLIWNLRCSLSCCHIFENTKRGCCTEQCRTDKRTLIHFRMTEKQQFTNKLTTNFVYTHHALVDYILKPKLALWNLLLCHSLPFSFLSKLECFLFFQIKVRMLCDNHMNSFFLSCRFVDEILLQDFSHQISSFSKIQVFLGYFFSHFQ